MCEVVAMNSLDLHGKIELRSRRWGFLITGQGVKTIVIVPLSNVVIGIRNQGCDGFDSHVHSTVREKGCTNQGFTHIRDGLVPKRML